jgi:hypothetical protein
MVTTNVNNGVASVSSWYKDILYVILKHALQELEGPYNCRLLSKVNILIDCIQADEHLSCRNPC